MKYHCYISVYESVYESDVEAESAADAAQKAATEHDQSGEWTVIAGEPVHVNVVMHPTYKVSGARP